MQSVNSLVKKFCMYKSRCGNPRFHAKDLEHFVQSNLTVAPDTPGRMLRQLRRSGAIDYKVIDAQKSLYEITSANI